MSDYILIIVVSLLASSLTFFSGFGLGTILTPVFAIFFPVETAIALTAVVHFLNNLFKLSLVWKNIHRQTVLRFGLPSLAGAFAGAMALLYFPSDTTLLRYTLSGNVCEVTSLKLAIAILIIIFALFELLPVLKNLQFKKNHFFAGGLLSGFFGGFSGHQGALRSAFLIRSGLDKEAFIASGIGIACMVDITRLLVYGKFFSIELLREHYAVLLSAVLAAFAGAWMGNKILKKATMKFVQGFVSIALLLLALALGAGIV